MIVTLNYRKSEPSTITIAVIVGLTQLLKRVVVHMGKHFQRWNDKVENAVGVHPSE